MRAGPSNARTIRLRRSSCSRRSSLLSWSMALLPWVSGVRARPRLLRAGDGASQEGRSRDAARCCRSLSGGGVPAGEDAAVAPCVVWHVGLVESYTSDFVQVHNVQENILQFTLSRTGTPGAMHEMRLCTRGTQQACCVHCSTQCTMCRKVHIHPLVGEPEVVLGM